MTFSTKYSDKKTNYKNNTQKSSNFKMNNKYNNSNKKQENNSKNINKINKKEITKKNKFKTNNFKSKTKNFKEKVNFKPKKNERKNQLIKRYEVFFSKDETSKLLNCEYELKNNQFLRINLSKTTQEKQEQFLKKNRVKFSKTFIKNALKIEKSFFNISSSLESLFGNIYLQDLASQIPINLIDFEELSKRQSKFQNSPITILDMAASPGSKTTQIAQFFEFHKLAYEITALEPEKKRLTKLINNIQKQKIENIKIINSTGQDFKTNQKYDLIILDAPCSGNFIDDNKWFEKRDLTGIQNNSKLQKQILKNAETLLKKEGTLIYSTCSLEPEENELNIQWAKQNLKLKTCPNNQLKFPFKTNTLKILNNKEIKDPHSIRIMPNTAKTQGFFISILNK